MAWGEQLTEKLNGLEDLTRNPRVGFFPKKLGAWLVLFVALMVTNLMAVLRWPFAALTKPKGGSELKPGETVDTNDRESLQVLLSNHPLVLVDFWAQWCGPCLLMDKTLKTLAAERFDVVIAKVDVSAGGPMTEHYGVKGLPTMILFKDGEEVTRKAGALTRAQLNGLLDATP